ncbi:MAG TPA: exosortase H, partial [Leucothrix sp.]|nr:exosortase H [Leucothrix sp.]
MQLSTFLMVLVSLFTLELIPFVHEAVIVPFTNLVAYVSAAVASFFDSSIQAEG